MWENAAQMQIVTLNWWQYAGRVWSHVNSAQPPNSHLAPQLKINTARWSNSLHIGGTWYRPSDPYTSSVCARLWRPEEPCDDEASSRLGSALFLAELQPTPGAQHCLVQLRWHLIPNMLNWIHVWTLSCPVHDLNILLVRKGCRVTCCMGRGIVFDVHKVTSKHACRPWQHLIPQDLDVPMPVRVPSTTTSSLLPHDGLHPIPWLTGHDFDH